VFSVFVEDIKLLKKLNKGSFTEWIGNTCLECKCWGSLGEILDPSLCHGSWDEVAFVEDKNEVFVRTFPLQILFNEFGPCPIRISCIQHIQQYVRTVNNFVQFFPNSLRLSF
jgi:hypothetical protein